MFLCLPSLYSPPIQDLHLPENRLEGIHLEYTVECRPCLFKRRQAEADGLVFDEFQWMQEAEGGDQEQEQW